MATRKVSDVIDPNTLKEAATKSNLRRQLTEMANRRFNTDVSREAFLNDEAPTLTDDEQLALADAELLIAVDPTR